MRPARTGFLAIPRSTFEDDPFWTERRKFSHYEAWLDLLQLAAFRPSEYRTEHGVDHLERGEFVASLRYLATRWRWSYSTVRRWIEGVLKPDHIVEQRVGQHGTVYRIAKYETYASPPAEGETPDETASETIVKQSRNKVEQGEQGEQEKQAPRATAEPATRVLPFPAHPACQPAVPPPVYQPQPRHEGRGRGARGEPGRGSKDFVEPAVEGAPVGWAVQLALTWARSKGHPGPMQEFAELMVPLIEQAVARGWGLDGAKKAISDAAEATRDEANVKGRPEITRFLTPRSFAGNASYWLDFANRSVAEDIQGSFVS